MSQWLLLDELHLGFRMPSGLPESAYRSTRRLLRSRAFDRQLRAAIQKLLAQRRSPPPVRFTLSR